MKRTLTAHGGSRIIDTAGAPSEPDHYVLKLYVTGATPNSTRALSNIRRICENELPGRNHLDVVDIYQEPGRAAEDQIVATPTLVKKQPLPECRLIGDLSNHQRVLSVLDLGPRDGSSQPAMPE